MHDLVLLNSFKKKISYNEITLVYVCLYLCVFQVRYSLS